MNHLGAIFGVLLLASTACSASRHDERTRQAKEGAEPADISTKRNDVTISKGKGAPASGPRPNVVVMLLDTLRPDFLGVYGAKTEPAPFLGELAKQSVVFDNALSTSSWTAPATASLFTGLYPPEHTVVQGFRAHRGLIEKMKAEGHTDLEVNRMPKDLDTLPEVFRGAGYRTFGLAANINIGDAIGFSRGFDRFERIIQAPAEEILKKVAGWRKEIVRAKPFFLYLHFNDAHTPYHQRRPFYQYSADPREDARARYRSEISYLDATLQKIWQLPGLRENTVLLVVSDHGEEFWERGGTKHGPTLFSELNRVVMMAHGPSAGIAPSRVVENVSLIDVLPTLAELAGIDVKTEREGSSLAPLLAMADGAAPPRRFHERCLFAHRMFSSIRNVAVWSVTCGHLKLIDWWGDRHKLYDHREDPGDLYDLSETRQKTAARLSDRLARFKDRMSRPEHAAATTEIALDETLLEQLRTLGYVE